MNMFEVVARKMLLMIALQIMLCLYVCSKIIGKVVPWQLCGTWKYLTDTCITKILLKLISASAESAEEEA